MSLHDTNLPPSRLRFSARTQDGFGIASLAGQLDIASAPTLREQLLGLPRPQACRLVIDLSNVSFCDASGLAVLVGTKRRAKLLGGVLRLAAPDPPLLPLHLTGLFGQFDVFPTVATAIAQPRATKRVPDISARARTHGETGSGGLAIWALTLAPGAPAAEDLQGAVTTLLAHADAWRDADPNRKFTASLRALAGAHARDDHAALTRAARSLLHALIRYPLTYSPVVAATATDLRRLAGPGASPPVQP